MATKTQANEREYVIPLRSAWSKAARYKRTRKSVMAIKEFIAKHMRVPDRDLDKVKLDVYLNNELWFRGAKKPPAKVKVKAVRNGDNIEVTLVETPDKWKFLKARQDKKHKKVEKKAIKPAEEKSEERTEEPTEQDKEKEEEKTKSVEQANIKIAEKAAKAQKHTVRGDGPQIQRKALKK